jgi:preprotein translocase subunit Sss1
MVGTATIISKTIMITRKGLGILMIFMLGFIVSLIFGVMKGK